MLQWLSILANGFGFGNFLWHFQAIPTLIIALTMDEISWWGDKQILDVLVYASRALYICGTCPIFGHNTPKFQNRALTSLLDFLLFGSSWSASGSYQITSRVSLSMNHHLVDLLGSPPPSTSMKVHVEDQNVIKTRLVCLFLFIVLLADATTPQNVKCPFQYLYHFGDGATDTGNSIRLLPFGPSLPPARLPYGTTYPGRPTGRWSDGLIEFDFTAKYLGLPNNVPYLSMNDSTRDSGVIFAVGRSPVLDSSFFKSRGIQIPPYVVPLSGQFKWFKTYLKSICATPKDCADRLGNSLLFMGDNEANDIGYALIQGKSIKEVTTYVPFVIRAIIQATRELIKMGATRIIVPGSAPLGCYPYILTALPNNDPTAYDNLGCLNTVNNLILSKNTLLQAEILKLNVEFPTTTILFADIYTAVKTVILQASLSGKNITLKACCGIGGKYNYDSRRFCGSPGVPVCSDPNEYIYWDGLHYTQETYNRYLRLLVPPTLLALKCTFI